MLPALLLLLVGAFAAGLVLRFLDGPARRWSTPLVLAGVSAPVVSVASGIAAVLEPDVSEKATLLARGISDAMNCSALLALILLAYVAATALRRVIRGR